MVKGKRWLAAVAETWWAAEQALERMAPRFKVADPIEGARIDEALDRGVRHGEPQRVATRGTGDEAMGTLTLAARYDVAPALHGTIETASCTARRPRRSASGSPTWSFTR